MKKSKELNKILMESMLGFLKMVKDKEREDTNGKMDSFLKASGGKEKRMVMVFGNLQTETAMLEIG